MAALSAAGWRLAILLWLLPLAGHAASPFTCVAEDRDGFATQAADGTISGSATTLCQQLATALGREVAASIRLILVEPDTGGALPPADVAFVSADLLAERGVAQSVITGPVVFSDPVQVLVPAASAIRTPDDLAGQIVCFMIGSPANRALESYFAGRRQGPIRLPFREGVEMLDAYNVGRCDATVVERSGLGDMLADTGINHLQSRVLDRAIGISPIAAVVSVVRKDEAARIFAGVAK